MLVLQVAAVVFLIAAVDDVKLTGKNPAVKPANDRKSPLIECVILRLWLVGI
jgi:hypothetical protein